MAVKFLSGRGDLEQPLEWARYIGFCNAGRDVYDTRHHAPTRSAILYTEQPKEMRYADLKTIVNALRTVGAGAIRKDHHHRRDL